MCFSRRRAARFPLSIAGNNFVSGSGSSASVILLSGQPRSTTCSTATTCATALNPADVESAATLTLQIQNPGPSGALSNPVPFVIATINPTIAPISLSSSQPVVSGLNIVSTEPTTAAQSSPINIDFIGMLANGSCGVQGSPLTIARPSSGSATASICIHGTGLDPTFTYAFTAPGEGNSDIAVTASAITGLFPNMIELDLQLSSATVAGVRSLMVTTPNNDRAVATGMLELQ